MSLPAKQRCPIHGQFTCCGREAIERKQKHSKYERVSSGVRRAPDGREFCSKAELKRRKDILLTRHPYCAGCGKMFTDYRDVELAHKESKGLGGGKRNDSWTNLCLMHREENREQGSRSLAEYLANNADRQREKAFEAAVEQHQRKHARLFEKTNAHES